MDIDYWSTVLDAEYRLEVHIYSMLLKGLVIRQRIGSEGGNNAIQMVETTV